MLRKLATLCFVLGITALSACSSPKIKNVVQDDPMPMVLLTREAPDQPSYAIGYTTTILSYQGRINANYFINTFIRGVDDWMHQRVSLSLEQIKGQIYQKSGLELKQHTYFNGILLGANLQQKFQQMKKGCWEQINSRSLVKGIYAALADLKKGQVRQDEDPYLVEGTEQLLKYCAK